MLGPLRINAALVAKQILSLDAVAGGGRAVLGIGLGGREDDYEVSGASMSERGAWQDRALAQIRRIFDGEGELEAKIGPRPPGDGSEPDRRWQRRGVVRAGRALRRRLDHGRRHVPISSRGAIEQLARGLEEAGPRRRAAEDGARLLLAGRRAPRDAERYLRDYYGFLGEELSGMIARRAATDADTVRAYVARVRERRL